MSIDLELFAALRYHLGKEETDNLASLTSPSTVPAPLRQLTDQLTSTGLARLTGVPHSTAEAFALAHVIDLVPRAWQVVYLVGSEREQKVFLDGLATWQSPASPRPVIAVPPLSAALLSRLARHEPVILIAQQSAFAESLPHPNELPGQFITITNGETVSPTTLAEDFQQLGYEFNRTADRPGSWAKRGEVVDVWPTDQDGAWRIVFNGTLVESIAPVGSKNPSLPSPTTLSCPPVVMTDADPRISLLSYLQPSRTLIIVPRPSLLDSLPRGREAIKQYKQLLLEPFGGEGVTKLDWRATAFFHSQWSLVSKDLGKLQADGYRLEIQSQRQDTLQGFFRRHQFSTKAVKWLNAPALTQGFIAPSAKYALFTDEELFGRDERARSNRRRVEEVFLGDLNEGDFVVHLDHGIGRFSGMRLQQVNAHTKEYFIIEYAEGDKLYVPVETADKITRYIGSPHPKLHKLSGSTWAAITKKIREDTSQIAKDLLGLYAERELAEAPGLLPVPELEEELAGKFPYELTPDQERTLQETMTDLEREVPMDRLICGDVGFGKTEVAIRAAFRAAVNKKQVAVLSPTTILTQQHFDTFRERLKGTGMKIGALSRFETNEEQNQVLAKLVSGEIDIVIGTHRLLSPDVKFKSLGLIIIDEEQRFGVRHKEKLKAMRTEAHVLTLTATPIPRTLNFALSGLRDISVIETPPEGRLPIETNIVPYADDLVVEVIQRELNRQGQIYYVYNNVDQITVVKNHLQKLMPHISIGIAHGQMDEHQLSNVMEEFDNKRLDVLLASTIIENGLDLPNVNTLVVDHATRFGLAQLYQLRGRIGRGNRQAYSYFLYHSERVAGRPQQRLQALMDAKELGSGFHLAMRDLEIRGTGNILGKKQHGHVTAIGLSLYARLLAQAVEELRTGRPARQTRDILIDLPMEIAIPKEFIPSEPKRLRLYQRLAALETPEDLHRFRREEFKQQTLPDPLTNLFEALELKILCQQAPITAIQQSNTNVDGVQKQKIFIKFSRMITPEQIGKLLERNQAWDFTPELIKIDREALGTKWLHEIKQVVKIFTEHTTPVANGNNHAPAT